MVLALLPALAIAVTPRFKDAPGTVRTIKTSYTITGTMEGLGMTMPFKALSTVVEVEKVTAAAGGVTLTRQMKEGSTSVTLTAPGDEEPQTLKEAFPGYTITYSRTAIGKISNLKITGDITKALDNSADEIAMQFLASGEGMEFPDRDLKVGDTWTGGQALPAGSVGKVEISAKYAYLGTEEVNGKSYLKMTCDVVLKLPQFKVKTLLGEIPMSMEVKGPIIMLFNEQAGEIFRQTYKLANTTIITTSEAGKATMTSTIEGTSQLVK